MENYYGREEVELIAALDISEYTMLWICLCLTYESLCSRELIQQFLLSAVTFFQATVDSSSDSEADDEEESHLLILHSIEIVFGVSNSGFFSKRNWNVFSIKHGYDCKKLSKNRHICYLLNNWFYLVNNWFFKETPLG